MTTIATGEDAGGMPTLSADIGTARSGALPLRGVGRDPRALPGLLERRRRRRPLGAHPLRRPVREALQQVEVFSTESTIVSDPDPDYMLLPLFLDPTEHLKYRQLYNARFSPGAVERLTPTAREACRETIETFLDRGRCDFIHDFADVFPTQVFLIALGLPLDDAPQMVDWVRKIFLGLAGTDTVVAAEAQRRRWPSTSSNSSTTAGAIPAIPTSTW